MRGQAQHWRYRLAGLEITTDRPAPGLGEAGYHDGSLEVRFVAGELQPEPTGWYLLPAHGVATAMLREDGRLARIAVPDDGALDVALQLRRVAPFAAALQGRVTLHAAALRLGGAAVALIGGSGAGKSTLATCLGRQGHAVIADDLLPCRRHAGQIVVPATDGGGEPAFVPLALLCFLQPRRRRQGGARLTPIGPRQALVALARNGFGELRSPRIWRAQFERYGELSSTAASFSLELPDALQRLDGVARELAAMLANEARR
jgi:hypothetical protein